MEPIFLHEIDIGNINAFRFNLPECVTGRNDVEITVEYGADPDDPNTVTGNVWARLGNSRIKAFICPENAAADPDPVTALVEKLNDDPVFSQEVNKFVKHFSRQA